MRVFAAFLMMIAVSAPAYAQVTTGQGLLPNASNAVLPDARGNLNAGPALDVRDYGPAGTTCNTSPDDSSAFQSALNVAASAPFGISSGGHTCVVSGDFTLPDNPLLIDLSLKQTSPNNASRRTLTKTSGTGPIRMVRVKVDRNGATTDGSLADAAGIWISGIDSIYMEDVECTGDGLGRCIEIVGGTGHRLNRLNIHDMAWAYGDVTNASTAAGNAVLHFATGPLASVLVGQVIADRTAAGRITTGTTVLSVDTAAHTVTMSANAIGGGVLNGDKIGFDPGSGGEKTNGLVLSGTTDTEVNSITIARLCGKIAGVIDRCFQTDGIDVVGVTNNVTINGGTISRVGEGIDASSTDTVRNLQVVATVFEDVDSFGLKYGGQTIDSGSVGVRCLRPGFGCTVVGPGTVAGGNTFGPDNITHIGARALDVGANGEWVASNIAAHQVLAGGGGDFNPTNVFCDRCSAVDRQTVKTMKYGFRNEPGALSNYLLSHPVTSGATVSPFLGWTAGFGVTSLGPAKFTPADATGVTDTANFLMLGLGSTVSYTPRYSNAVLVRFVSGSARQTVSGSGVQWRLRYGTGTAPTNGTNAATGCGGGQCGTDALGQTPRWTAAAADQFLPFTPTVKIIGVVPGTAYWFDAAFKVITSGTGSLIDVQIEIEELL